MDLDNLEKLCEAAPYNITVEWQKGDVDFFKAAYHHIPLLIAEVRRLEREVKTLRSKLIGDYLDKFMESNFGHLIDENAKLKEEVERLKAATKERDDE